MRSVVLQVRLVAWLLGCLGSVAGGGRGGRHRQAAAAAAVRLKGTIDLRFWDFKWGEAGEKARRREGEKAKRSFAERLLGEGG